MQAPRGRITKSGLNLVEPTSITFDGLLRTANEWGGTFVVGEQALLHLQPGCRLEMDDGRSGEIVLFRRDAGSDRTAVIHFHGVGLLQSW